MSKERLLLFIFLAFLNFGLSIAQTTQSISLNGYWSFKTDPYGTGEKEGWFKNSVNTTGWDSMAVPGNWDLKNEYTDYAGDAWYTRQFTVQKSLSNLQIRIFFESVYNNATIWINGQEVGKNDLGFLSFSFEITKLIKFGTTNRVTLKVNNVHKRGAIWNWGGIRRRVSLECTPPTSLDYQHIDAIPDLNTGQAQINHKLVCSNSTISSKNVKLEIKIKRNGKIIKQNTISATLPKNTQLYEVKSSLNLEKSMVELWHFDYPNLYESEISLTEGNKVIHTITDHFGIRKLEFKGLEFLLNGERIRPVGFNLVPEDRFTGNTLPMHRIKEDVDLMKSCGANFARLSHLPLPKAFLDYLDQKGIMVFEEVGLWGKDEMVDPNHPLPKEMLKRMVKEKYNHPCIIGWSLGNEIGDEEKNPKIHEYIKGAMKMAKELDPNRFALYVSNTVQRSKEDAAQYGDFSMCNAYGGWSKAADQAWTFHNKPVFMSEFGDALNSDDPNLGLIPIQKMMNSMRNKEYVFGASLWTLNDYRSTYYGQPGWVTAPSQNRAWGIVTTFREKKRSFYEAQKEYSPLKNLAFYDFNKAKDSIQIQLTPRSKLDIPANTLRGYQLRFLELDQDLKILEDIALKLKDIQPGDAPFLQSIKWKNSTKTNSVKILLIDPQGYTVIEEIKHFNVPNKPRLKHSITANNGVRIMFDKSPDAFEYFVKYGKGDSTFFSPKTINSYIDIEDTKIKQGEIWTYELIAVNDAGESLPSDAVMLKRDEGELPPIIWGYKTSENGVFVAYSVNPYDYLYEVEMGAQSGKYTDKLTTKLKGVLNIKKSEKDKPLYFRMRVIKQWGFASKWTNEIKVE